MDPEGATGDITQQAATPADVPVGSRKGQRAPAFELPFLSGGKGHLSLSDLRGKVVLVTFWASWCGPCRMEVPALDKHWAKLRTRDVVIIGISIDDKKTAATGFLDRFPVDYPMLFDEAGGTVANTWGVSSIPATILIDKDGVVQERHLGYSPTMLANTMRDISELLQE
jgi:cytochrome c biogenesis protein CcmG, thiol:disulfide interchange protein DsbE